jgi:hypothetical protein
MRSLISAVALAALTAVAVPAMPATAAKKKPKPPTTATIKRLLTDAYCAPKKNARGEDVTSVKVTFKSIKRKRARVGDAVFDGTPPSRKTYVFPVYASYFCDYQYTNDIGGLKAHDYRISGNYSFFRDLDGKWTQTNHAHKVETLPGNN